MRKILKFFPAFCITILFTMLFFTARAQADAPPFRINLENLQNGGPLTSTIHATGWSASTSGVNRVEMSIDGVKIAATATYLDRPDVLQYYPEYAAANPKSGYQLDANLDLSRYTPGSHELKITSYANDGQTATFTIHLYKLSMKLNLDSPAQGQTTGKFSAINFHGWSLDTTGIKSVTIYVDGSPAKVNSMNLNTDRPDVGAAILQSGGYGYKDPDDSGYSGTIDASGLSLGTHTMTAVAMANDGEITSITNRFTLTTAKTLINLEQPGNGGIMQQNLRLTGWSANPSGVRSLEVKVDGATVSADIALAQRGDVDAAYPDYTPSNPQSGYVIDAHLDLAKYAGGAHTLQVYSYGNDGSYTSYTVTLYKLSMKLYLDGPAAGQTVSKCNLIWFHGWTLDTSGIASVNFFVDGAQANVSSVAANQPRPDVYSYVLSTGGYGYSDTYNSGYTGYLDTTSLSLGTHTFTAVATANDGEKITTSNTFTLVAPSNFLSLDTLHNGDYMQSSFTAAGWSANGSGVKSMTLSLDGTVIDSNPSFVARPDVQNVYPDYTAVNPKSGYVFNEQIDMSKYRSGSHTLVVTSYYNDGSSLTNTVSLNMRSPLMNIDEPATSSSYPKYGLNDSVTVRGWATDMSQVDHVQIVLDDGTSVNAALGGGRGDIQQVYSQYPNASSSGYSYTFAGGTFKTNGIHIITVTSFGKNGDTVKKSVAIVVGSDMATTLYNTTLAQMKAVNNYYDDNYLNPSVVMTQYSGYQFMSLKYGTSNLTADIINNVLYNSGSAHGGVLAGHGQDFLDAAVQYNVNPLYLVAHACWETGYGTSTLSKGQVADDGVTYYNMFGFGAYDSNPNYYGLQRAQREGWSSVRSAIIGGTRLIATSYINSIAIHQGDGKNHYDQDTLYEMKWDPKAVQDGTNPNEYATSYGWANGVANLMYKFRSMITDGNMTITFDVPQFN